MGIIFRMLDVVATGPVQALFKSILIFSSSSFLAPFPRSFKFPHINSRKFFGSQHLHYGHPTISTSLSYFQERSASAFMLPYHSELEAETRAPHYSRASQICLFQLSSSFFSSQLIHPLNQMIRQQEIRNSLLYNIFMPAIPTDHFPFHHLRF